jgi:hypothetical protein
MHDHDTQAPAERLTGVEQYLLFLLIEGGPPIWSVDDLAREVENPGDARIAVLDLQGAGLVHKTTDGFVFATRAASRLVEITEHTI